MSYETAYTASFHSLAGVAWTVEIDLPGHTGQAQQVSLDADRPITIEWQETKVSDALQPSTCTVRVVNAKDRQMLRLMTDRRAMCRVKRDGEDYWTGLLDDAVYEEPYSYRSDYVTEITFSDFGALNRATFEPSGVKSLLDVVQDCLATARLDGLGMSMQHSLMHTLIRPAALNEMYVNTRRFEGMTMRETLEGVLASLGMRLIQTGGELMFYDIDSLVKDAEDYPNNVVPVTWMGTDARLRGSETYGRFELDFDRMSEPVVADGSMDPDKANWTDSERYYAWHFEPKSEYVGKGFFVGLDRHYAFHLPLPTLLHEKARYFRTLPAMTDSHEAGVAFRVCCHDSAQGAMRNLLATSTSFDPRTVAPLFSVESRFIPVQGDRRDYQLRVSLDILLSIKYNPFEDAEHQGADVEDDWEYWKTISKMVYVPVKLELIDDDGNVLMHYRNSRYNAVSNSHLIPLGYGKGAWVEGGAEWWEMVLAYYSDDLSGNPLGGWSGNGMAFEYDRTTVPDILKMRERGEYLPLPAAPGRIRLTVSDGITTERAYDLGLSGYDRKVRWQLYRNPKVTLVRSGLVDDGVDKDEVAEVDETGPGDTLGETSVIGTGGGKVSPASLGALFNANGDIYTGFVKNGTRQSLLRHRLHSLIDQLGRVRPTLSGTATLAPFLTLRSDASTNGMFLPVGMMQDPREDTEELVMTFVHEIPDRYSFAWSVPVCARVEQGYRHAWSGPVCARLKSRYTFAWSNPVCVRKQMTLGPVWEDI